MGRPRSFDRDVALDCALRAFWERGFDQTTISDLADAMGINPPSLYAAFGDKQTLFAETVECYQDHPRNFTAAAREEPTVRRVVERLLRDAAAEYTAPDHPPGCMVISEPRLADLRAEGYRALAERFRRGVDEGDLPADSDVEALARYIVAVLTGMSASARDGASAAELLAVAELAIAAWPADQR